MQGTHAATHSARLRPGDSPTDDASRTACHQKCFPLHGPKDGKQAAASSPQSKILTAGHTPAKLWVRKTASGTWQRWALLNAGVPAEAAWSPTGDQSARDRHGPGAIVQAWAHARAVDAAGGHLLSQVRSGCIHALRDKNGTLKAHSARTLGAQCGRPASAHALRTGTCFPLPDLMLMLNTR
jgi:hypothetical protein